VAEQEILHQHHRHKVILVEMPDLQEIPLGRVEVEVVLEVQELMEVQDLLVVMEV